MRTRSRSSPGQDRAWTTSNRFAGWSARRPARGAATLPDEGIGHAVRVLADFDEVLVGARAGAPGAFTALYRDLAGPVAGYARSKGVRDVEDLVSDVFMAVFTTLASFEGGQGQFRSWVFTIAHRRVVDGWRRDGRTPDLTPYEAAADERVTPSAESDALARLGEERVLALLSGLTPEQRDVLTLRVVADLTVEQVAEVVGRRPGAVKALQRRALAAVRKALAQEGVPL